MVFEKTLTDIVKGIRASKRDTALYISSCIAEIKKEINSTDPHTKSNALQKLTFLQMMGYNMSWASFATIEVMSSPRFAFKRVGYLAASQAFTQDTDVILLATNTIKKEIRGAGGTGTIGMYEAGLAINCLSNIVTEDLARELLSEVTNLTSHPQPYLRKKAVLCLFKLFVKYPQGLRLTFGRIQECLLRDSDPSVVSCAVNVITELSDKNPRNYLVLAPSFFALLTNSSNNWMLIKVVKLLGSLVSEEPRLARKLLEPLAQIVKNTQAKSLLYEAVYTITLSLPHCRKLDGSMPSMVPAIVELCAETLKGFVMESDQNLKYLGLVGFGSLMTSNPKVLNSAEYRPLILACLSDEDVTIRMRALDLLYGVATRRNIMELVTQLLRHVDLATGVYKAEMMKTIVGISSSDKYALLEDFAWYIDVLVILAHTNGLEGNGGARGMDIGKLIASQLVDVALRVLPIRPYAVRRMIGILLEGGGMGKSVFLEKRGHTLPEVLPSAAWIVGEYSTLIDEGIAMDIDANDGDEDEDELQHFNSNSEGTYHAVIQALTHPSNIEKITLSTQSIYIQASMKVLVAASSSDKCPNDMLEKCIYTLATYLPIYMKSMNTEIQERAFTSFQLLVSFGLIQNDTISDKLSPRFTSIDHAAFSSDEDSVSKGTSPSNTLENFITSSSKNDPGTSRPSLNASISDTDTSIAAKCRAISSTLKYILIPEQMKPVSMKAQRKKQQSASSQIHQVLESPVKISLFSKVLQMEYGPGSNHKSNYSLEAITFTQQKQIRVAEQFPKAHGGNTRGDMNLMNEFGSNHGTNRWKNNSSPGNLLNGAEILQSSGARQSDPFYLSSKQDKNDHKQSAPTNNRFNAIHLFGDDEDEDKNEVITKKKRKKDKKEKKTKKLNMNDTDFNILGVKRNNLPEKQQIYDSDDDEDESITNINNKSSHLRGFEDLAMVDLTTPLGDDELMPMNNHRTVPPRTSQQPANISKDTKEENTSSRRVKKKKNKKDSKQPSTKADATSDLLGYGDLVSSNGDKQLEEPLPSSSVAGNVQSNPINDAFDDLLALDIPTGPQLDHGNIPNKNANSDYVLPSGGQFNIKSIKSFKKIWLKASIKFNGKHPVEESLEWRKITLSFRTHIGKGNSSAKVSLKLINLSLKTSLKNVRVNIKDSSEEIQFGDSNPNSEIEGNAKIGPFASNKDGVIPAIRGTITSDIFSLPVKIIFPSTFALSPISGLTSEEVMSAISIGKWSSHSAKLNILVDEEISKVISMIRCFLRAEDVETGVSCMSNVILASKSSTGDKLFTLVKAGSGEIKLDFKSTSKALSKSISSDIKRLIF